MFANLLIVNVLLFEILVFGVFCTANAANGVPWLEQMQHHDLLDHECKRLNLTNRSMKYEQLDHILVDRRHKFLYCYVPKVACTNWKRLLMVLTGKYNATNDDISTVPADKAHEESWQVRLNSLENAEIKKILSDDSFTLFLMVRHPFERLLSAYRNKLEPYGRNRNPSAKYFQSVFKKRILKKYRKSYKSGSSSTAHAPSVTFKEFARFLLDEGVDGANVNEHWRSVKELCLPCRLNYTFVGKYETFAEDTRSVLKMIGAPPLRFPQTRSANTAQKLQWYFRQLDVKLIERLHKLYEADFKLFGYGPENVLGYDFG